MKKYAAYYLTCLLCTGIFTSCEKESTDPEPEPEPSFRTEILYAPYTADMKKGWLIILSEQGDTLGKKELTSAGVDFRRWVVNRDVRYSYLEYNSANKIDKVDHLPGNIVILDKNLNKVNKLSLVPANGRTAADPNGLDGHDFILLGDDHYIAMAYYVENSKNVPVGLNPDPGAKVVTAVVQEVKTGEVVWEWDGGKYAEFYTSSMEGNKFNTSAAPHDYMHMTGMLLDPADNNIIISMRNLDQVIKINRGTGKIMWRLGGKNSDFPLSADRIFTRQSHISFADENETLVVFDNGSSSRQYSRIMEYKLDEVAKKVESFKSFTIPAGYISNMGSVQKKDSSYFIGGGTMPKIWEINLKTGLVQWEIYTGGASARAYKY
jgi:arylsulfate sulfotransferase